MNIKQIIKILTDSGIEKSEAKIEAKMLFKHFLGMNNVDLVLDDNFDENSQSGRALLLAAKERATTEKPIQHIIGTAYFMGEDFVVNEHVLIPRDETEILVRKAVEIIRGIEAKRHRGKVNFAKQNLNLSTYQPINLSTILDIGTGSGCIACMIAKLTETQVIGVDISTDALQIALDNSEKLKLFNKAIFRKSNLFSNVTEKFDLIVSNPPYIPLSEKETLQAEVKFEPESALFATDLQGIEFYDRIIQEAPKFLNDGGYLLFELGINQSELVKKLMEKAGFTNIKIEKDLAQIDRIIYGRL